MHRRSTPTLPVAIATALVLTVAGAWGCMTRAAIAPREDQRASVAPAAAVPAGSRPAVKVTAADMYSWGPGAASQQLEFYDEVESREIVAHDDVLHAALLFGRGSSAPTFAQRSALVREQGWVDRSFNRPPAEAATVGEVSQIMARVMGLDGSSQSDAVAALGAAGVLPDGLEASQGISGRQFLALLGRSYDWLEREDTSAARPLAARPPPVDLEAQALTHAEPAPTPVREEPVAAAPRAMAEPLPEPARPQPAPAAASVQPQEEAPAPAPSAPPQAEPAPPPATPTPRPWVGGRPLGKKRS